MAKYLEQRGFQIVRRNFCVRGGEIDIIAQNEEYLLFVEVKTRKADSLTSGYDAFTQQKKKLLVKTGALWCQEHPTALQIRFDLACVVLSGTKLLLTDYIENVIDTAGSEFIF